MIGTITRGAGFGGLVRYLLHGDREEPNPDRVAWVVAENLPTKDPELAASVMRATANQNPRGVEKPVWHLSLAWHPDDHPTRAQMEDAARRVLYQLGLSEHQALLVAHRDTEHAHVHLVVNRVHPESLEVWKGWRDMVKVEQALRYLELENGYRATPGHHGRLPGQERPDRTQGLTRGEERQRQREGTEAWSDRMRDTLRPHFREAETWADLEHRLSEQGVRLQKKGRGLVVTDGTHQVKASRIDRGGSIQKLEARFEMRFNDWRAQVDELRSSVEQLQSLETREHRLASLRYRLGQAVATYSETARTFERLERKLWDHWGRLSGQVQVIYRPDSARAAFERIREVIGQEGSLAAAAMLERSPRQFGKLAGRGFPRADLLRKEALLTMPPTLWNLRALHEAQSLVEKARGGAQVAARKLAVLNPRLNRIWRAAERMSTQWTQRSEIEPPNAEKLTHPRRFLSVSKTGFVFSFRG